MQWLIFPLLFLAQPTAPVEKARLTEAELEKKHTGGYVTGLPLLNSDPSKGIGYGVRAYYYYNGYREDWRFPYTPYLYRFYAQFFQTTNGYSYHTLDWDAPYLAGSLFRARGNLTYERNITANYFGIGETTLGRLRVQDETFKRFSDFDARLNQVVAGKTLAYYDKYDILKPQIELSLERDLFGGRVRPLGGISVSNVKIRDYAGKTVRVNGTPALNTATRLSEDKNKLVGFQGGWNNTLKLGVAYDSRDFEPDPNSGIFAEMVEEWSNRAFGSSFNYLRTTASLRAYHSPITSSDIVLAGRLVYSFHAGTPPFFALHSFNSSEEKFEGLGGRKTLRGFRQDRFIGQAAALANAEIRWTFADTAFAGQHFAFILAPFVDAGRVFDAVPRTTLRDWKFSEGAGLRIAWNQATIIMVDYGVSGEDSGLYINFTHIF